MGSSLTRRCASHDTKTAAAWPLPLTCRFDTGHASGTGLSGAYTQNRYDWVTGLPLDLRTTIEGDAASSYEDSIFGYSNEYDLTVRMVTRIGDRRGQHDLFARRWEDESKE